MASCGSLDLQTAIRARLAPAMAMTAAPGARSLHARVQAATEACAPGSEIYPGGTCAPKPKQVGRGVGSL